MHDCISRRAVLFVFFLLFSLFYFLIMLFFRCVFLKFLAWFVLVCLISFCHNLPLWCVLCFFTRSMSFCVCDVCARSMQYESRWKINQESDFCSSRTSIFLCIFVDEDNDVDVVDCFFPSFSFVARFSFLFARKFATIVLLSVSIPLNLNIYERFKSFYLQYEANVCDVWWLLSRDLCCVVCFFFALFFLPSLGRRFAWFFH